MLKVFVSIFIISFATFINAEKFTDKIDSKKVESSQINSEVNNVLGNLHKVGEGKMRIMFWDVYTAELYGSKAHYIPASFPQALKLTYHRNIDSEEFIDATEDQWNKLRKKDKSIAVDNEIQNSWLAQLSAIFPNINTNDVIILVINQNKGSEFYLKKFNSKTEEYHNLINIGSINDVIFSDYFLSIWLSKYTTEPKLRQKLIGEVL